MNYLIILLNHRRGTIIFLFRQAGPGMRSHKTHLFVSNKCLANNITLRFLNIQKKKKTYLFCDLRSFNRYCQLAIAEFAFEFLLTFDSRILF